MNILAAIGAITVCLFLAGGFLFIGFCVGFEAAASDVEKIVRGKKPIDAYWTKYGLRQSTWYGSSKRRGSEDA